MTILWPLRVLTPVDVSVDLQANPISGGPSMSGGMQFIQSDAGYWTISYGSVAIHTPQQVKLWRAIAGMLSGPVVPIMVPAFDKRAPWPLDEAGNEIRTYGDIPFDDCTLFDDGTGFYQPVIDATAGTASAGATSLDITMNYGSEPESGQFFSVGERLYQIVTVDDSAAPLYTCTVTPPLREAIAADATCDFDNPACRMRLASAGEMKLTLASARFGSPTVNFIEDL